LADFFRTAPPFGSDRLSRFWRKRRGRQPRRPLLSQAGCSGEAANRGGPGIGLTIARGVIIKRVGARTPAGRASNRENALAALECRGRRYDSRGAALGARRGCWLEWQWHHEKLPDVQAGARPVSQPPTPRPQVPLPVMPASYMKPRFRVCGSSPTERGKTGHSHI
jgi:hypothetical protein